MWILDGLEVTMVGGVAARLTDSDSGIDINAGQIGTATAIYIVATVATAFSFAPWYFFLCRFVTGAGIGGEYSAINSAIDELIPARVRAGST